MKGTKPICLFNFPEELETSTLHLAYHVADNIGEHYSSVRMLGDEERMRALPIELLPEWLASLPVRSDGLEKITEKLQSVSITSPSLPPKSKGKKGMFEIDDDSFHAPANRHDKCPCGSGRKFIKCCRSALISNPVVQSGPSRKTTIFI
eukprot:TRINITY_DN489_c0_g4_i2.p1 TRINITY_DN489_c0_g4~~TRINITY_DN489_c0_g4_i2.p1  ORF type:complete len:149 (-),score=35.45 TRINITY_DN489_c0_g4_i2:25-471(-)